MPNEDEYLDLLQHAILTPATLDRLLTAVNAELPPLAEANREIANYTRAVGPGDFTSLETALAAAGHRWATLLTELTQLDGSQQPAVIQPTPAVLQRHLYEMTEKLRSEVNGRVREAIQASLARILVAMDGSLTIEAKPDGLLGVEQTHAHLGDTREESPMIRQAITSSSDRHLER